MKNNNIDRIVFKYDPTDGTVIAFLPDEAAPLVLSPLIHMWGKAVMRAGLFIRAVKRQSLSSIWS